MFNNKRKLAIDALGEMRTLFVHGLSSLHDSNSTKNELTIKVLEIAANIKNIDNESIQTIKELESWVISMQRLTKIKAQKRLDF